MERTRRRAPAQWGRAPRGQLSSQSGEQGSSVVLPGAWPAGENRARACGPVRLSASYASMSGFAQVPGHERGRHRAEFVASSETLRRRRRPRRRRANARPARPLADRAGGVRGMKNPPARAPPQLRRAGGVADNDRGRVPVSEVEPGEYVGRGSMQAGVARPETGDAGCERATFPFPRRFSVPPAGVGVEAGADGAGGVSRRERARRAGSAARPRRARGPAGRC